MSTIHIDSYYKIPEVIYPMDESYEVEYRLGYYAGTCFRVVFTSNDFQACVEHAETYHRFSNRDLKDYYIMKVAVNVQKHNLYGTLNG